MEASQVTVDSPPPPDHRAQPRRPLAARAIRVLEHGGIVILLLLGFLATIRGWLPGRILVPTDSLLRVTPWRDAHSPAPSGNDALHIRASATSISWTTYAVARLKAHQIPLWDPHTRLGEPFIGFGRSGVFYPTILLHLLLPPTWSWTLAAALRLWIAGIGAWLLARRHGLSPAARLLAGGVFMLCGLHVIGVQDALANVMVWLPWVIVAVERLVERVSPVRITVAAIVLAIQFLGGDPAANAAVVLTCVAALATARPSPSSGTPGEGRGEGDFELPASFEIQNHPQPNPLPEYRERGQEEYRQRGFAVILSASAAAFISLAIGFALAGVQTIPLVEYFANVPKIAAAPSIDASALPWGISLMRAGGLTPALVGLVPALLALLAILAGWRRRGVMRWLLISLLVPLASIVFAKALRQPLLIGPASLAPSVLAIAMLAALGLEDLPRLLNSTRAMRCERFLFGLAIVAAAIGFILAIIGWFLRVRHPLLAGEGVRLIGTGAVAFLAAALIIFGRRSNFRSSLLPWGFVSLAMAELLALAIPFLTTTKRPTIFPPNAAIDALNHSLVVSRFAAAADVLPPDIVTGIDAAGLNDIRASQAFAPSPADSWLSSPTNRDAARRLLNVKDWIAPAGAAAPGADWKTLTSDAHATVFEDPAAFPRAWVARRVEHHHWRFEVLERMSRPWDFDPRETILADDEIDNRFDEPLTPRWWTQTGTGKSPEVTVRWESPESFEITVRGGGNGWLVVSNRYDPGWQATVSGRATPTIPAFGVMQAVPIGINSEVRFAYDPPAWRYGYFASLAGGIVLLLLLAMGMMKRPQPRGAPSPMSGGAGDV